MKHLSRDSNRQHSVGRAGSETNDLVAVQLASDQQCMVPVAEADERLSGERWALPECDLLCGN